MYDPISTEAAEDSTSDYSEIDDDVLSLKHVEGISIARKGMTTHSEHVSISLSTDTAKLKGTLGASEESDSSLTKPSSRRVHRRKSIKFACPKVNFEEVRHAPQNFRVLLNKDVCKADILTLLGMAPPHAKYSDGDFMCTSLFFVSHTRTRITVQPACWTMIRLHASPLQHVFLSC
jgi:hypothetical protein